MTAISRNRWSESDQKAIREQLGRILNSGPFRHSQRRQRFLEYLVNETLAGRGERLKGYNSLWRSSIVPRRLTPSLIPSCGSRPRRLREKLREYYGADGQSDPIRIDLTEGHIHTANRVSARGCSANCPPGGASNTRSLLHCSLRSRSSVR